MPFLDFINHSFEPNIVLLPFKDAVTDESYVIVQAIRDIKKDE